MNGTVVHAIAFASGGIAGSLLAMDVTERLRSRKRKRATSAHQASLLAEVECAGGGEKNPGGEKSDLSTRLVAYAQDLSHALMYHAKTPISPCVKSGNERKTQAEKFLAAHAVKAGCDRLSTAGFIEARLRLALTFGIVGTALGAFVSWEMTFLLGGVGVLAGWKSISKSISVLEHKRGVEAESRISEMLEVVSLGLRSGLSFDRSFAMYGDHFDSPFAQSCASACRSWSLGLLTREEALRGLAASYNCETLERATENIVRSLRFGSSFADDLEELAAQSRAEYRSKVSERVAKAPVKMMLPTGALILPAMLLLVLGPILLELAQGF